MSILITDIRQKIDRNEFELSKHAVDRSILRGIRIDEIKEAIANGQIIEDYPDDKYFPSCLICGLTLRDRILHIHCSYPSRPLIKIITLYEPDINQWNKDFTKRK